MTKDDNINIKLEVCRENKTKNITILAHFDAKSPNIIIDKNEFIWIPTIEEKDFIKDAFNFIPINRTISPPKPVQKEKNENVYQRIEEPNLIKNTEPAPEIKPEIEEKIEEIPALERKEPKIEEVTNETIPLKNDEIEEDKKQDEMSAKVNIRRDDTPRTNEEIEENKEKIDEGIIVEADANAIEAALQKHTVKEDDNSIVEADEETIINKVLSQKKKRGWSKK